MIAAHLATLVADTTTPTGSSGNGLIDQILPFLNFGIIGILVVLIVSKKWLVPAWTLEELKETHDRELAQKDSVIADKDEDLKELKESTAALQALTREQVIPALVRANQLSADYVAELARRSRLDARDG
jgi:hypothetical protein